MSTFFQQTAQAMIVKHIDRFPLWSWIVGFHDQRFFASTAVLGRRPGKAVTSDDVHAVLEAEGG